jgi:hypothetical protein
MGPFPMKAMKILILINAGKADGDAAERLLDL